MHATYTLTVERQTTGLECARWLGKWGGYALMLLGIPVLLDIPKVSETWPLAAILLWLLWSGAFAMALSFALPELYILLNIRRIRWRDAGVEISPAGLRIDGVGMLAWHRFQALAGECPDSILVMRNVEPWLKLSGPASQECLAALRQQCPPRRLPDISPDGTLLDSDDDAFASGVILSQRHGGTDVLYTFHADEGLAACAAQDSRILLGYASQTFADRRMGAVANALVMLILAVLPALGLASLFGREVGLPVGLVILLGAALWGSEKEMTTPGTVWTRREWIDLETRTWNARREFPDQSLPTQSTQLPLADLTLVCFTQHWEQGESHEVGLCKLHELCAAKNKEPSYLNVLYSADTPDEASRFAQALATMWGIACWKIEGGWPIQKRKLA
jgi:hypothetical protein